MSIKNFCMFFLLLCILNSNAEAVPPPGHLQPLGFQLPPVSDVLTLDTIPSPQDFFNKFVSPGKPVLFKGAATKTPAYELWTDNYLSSKFGKLMFDVEEGKKENRSKEVFNMPLEEFLKSYQEKDVYLVTSIPNIMRDDIYLLKCLLCGGFTDDLKDSVMWFSNGGTKSVLHYDAIDNINCLMSGSKDLYMVDKKEHAHINIDKPQGSYCSVDVDKVDLEKYPGLADVPWYKAHMEPGDCLFIPYRWFHQVRSQGPRNLAINIWFGHKLVFNSTDCDISPYKNKEFVPLSSFHVSEDIGADIKLLITDEMEGKPVDETKWLAIVTNILSLNEMPSEGVQMLQEVFKKIDTNEDLLISPEEVQKSSLKEYEKRLMEMLPSEEDKEEDDEEDDAEDDVEYIDQENLTEDEVEVESAGNDFSRHDGDL